tara:strand:- start:18 stop:554 length:537 start_codon:yes stop_codon:yes gene_type:complete
MIDPATLRKLLDYDPDTGALTWKRRTAELHPNDGSRKRFNSKFSNGPAFYTDTGNGYLQGSVFNIIYKTHRVAWALHYGEWPNVIDHINRVKSDNRISNLRSVTHSENLRNASMPSTNTSGHVGVFWLKNRSKWRAYIKINQKQINLGVFPDKDDAIKARKVAEAKYGFHENHGRDAT